MREQETAGSLKSEAGEAGGVWSLGPEQTVSKELGKAEGGEWEALAFPVRAPDPWVATGAPGPLQARRPWDTVLKRQAAARCHAVTRPGRLCVCTAFCESTIQHQDGDPSQHPPSARPPLPPAGRVRLPHPSERQSPVVYGPTVWAAKCKPGPGSCVGHSVKHAFPRDFTKAMGVCPDLLLCGQQSHWTRAHPRGLSHLCNYPNTVTF